MTHHVSPLTALKLAISSDDFFGGYTLLANLSTYSHILLSKPCCPISTTTRTSTPHPELLIANHLFNDYISIPRGSFHNEGNFAIGTSRPVCHWCSLYFESISIQLAQDYCAKMEERVGRFRSDKQVVVSSMDTCLRDSGWVIPADDSPPDVRRQLEMLVGDEFEKAVRWLREVGAMSREERDLEIFELGLMAGEKKRKREEGTQEVIDGIVKRRRVEVEVEEETKKENSMWRRVEREIGGVFRWVWRMYGASEG